MRSTTLTLPTRRHAAPDTTRAAGEQPVAEIVTFRLAGDADPAAFVEAAQAMDPFLHDTGSVRSRTLSVDANGLWTDYITWSDMASARKAAEVIMQAPEAAPFMQMIDPETVTLRHADIELTLKLE